MIRRAEREDLQTLAELAVRLWEGHTVPELAEDFAGLMSQGAQFFLCYDSSMPVGFAQCQLRHDYVEGTSSSPVGYLEGIYVLEAFRKRGHGKALLTACQEWAAEQGCQEFASDCELANSDSLAFHMAAGFTEANRIICFVKNLKK